MANNPHRPARPWITLTAALKETAKTFGISEGAAKLKIIEACREGHIPSEWRGEITGNNRHIPRQEWADADIGPGEVLILASGKRKALIDLGSGYFEAWRLAPASDPPKPKNGKGGGPSKRNRAQPMRDEGRKAIAGAFPDGAPNRAELPDKRFCDRARQWYDADRAKRGVPSIKLHDDAILRASGRKK